MQITLGNGQQVNVDAQGNFTGANGTAVSNATVAGATAGSGAAAGLSTYVPPNPNDPITSNTLKNQSQLGYSTPSTAPPTNIAGIDTSSANTLSAGEQQASDLSTRIQALNDQEAGKAGYQTEQNNAAGVAEATQAVNDINTSVKQLQKEAAAATTAAQGQVGAPSFVVNADTAQIERARAVKALTLSALSDALGNNLVSAQAKADKAVADKYAPIEAEIAAKTKNLDLILKDPATTLAQTNRANAQKVILEAQTQALAQQKTDQANTLKVATEAATKAANFKKSAQYPTLASALNAIGAAKTPLEATQIAASVGLTQDKVTPTAAETTSYAVSQASSQLNAAKGTDGYTDPNLYARLRASSTLSASDFDNRFSYLVNPLSTARLGITNTNTSGGALTPVQMTAGLNWILNNKGTPDDQEKFKTDRAFQAWVLSQSGG